MKALPTVHQVKMRHSEKNFVPEQKHFNIKNFLCSELYLFIFNLVSMTTVKISFVFFFHATVSVYQISI